MSAIAILGRSQRKGVEPDGRSAHRLFGVGGINASCPASVMQYMARPRSSDRRLIQPLAIMAATICLPAGCSFSTGNPSMELIFWSATARPHVEYDQAVGASWSLISTSAGGSPSGKFQAAWPISQPP
jgi:hypothetical protein